MATSSTSYVEVQCGLVYLESMLIFALFSLAAAGIEVDRLERMQLHAMDTLLRISMNRRLGSILGNPAALEKWANRNMEPQEAHALLEAASGFEHPYELLRPWFTKRLGFHSNPQIVDDLVSAVILELAETPAELQTWALVRTLSSKALSGELRAMGVYTSRSYDPDLLERIATPDPIPEPDLIPVELEVFARFFLDGASLGEISRETGLSTRMLCQRLRMELDGLALTRGMPAVAAENNRLVWACRLDSIEREALPKNSKLFLTRTQYDLVRAVDVDQMVGTDLANRMGWSKVKPPSGVRDQLLVSRNRVRTCLREPTVGPNTLLRCSADPGGRREKAYVLKSEGVSWLLIGREIGHTDPRSMAYRHARDNGLPWPPGRTDDPFGISVI